MYYCSSMPHIDMEGNRGVTRRNNITSLKVRLVSTASGHKKIIIMIIIIELQINIIQNVDQKKEKNLYTDNKYVMNRYILLNMKTPF